MITIGVSESNLRMSYRLLDSDPENNNNIFFRIFPKKTKLRYVKLFSFH